jgi:hypothetical protein
MIQGLVFLKESGSISMLLMFIVFCSMGFLGMSCFAALTKKFGALTSAITSTTRKGLTLVLSYVCFPHDKAVTLGHIFGALVFLSGLVIKSIQKSEHHPHPSSPHHPQQFVSPTSPTGLHDEENPGERIIDDWELPFGSKTLYLENENGHRRKPIVVGGSVHCEGEAGGGIGGLGLEIETDDDEEDRDDNDHKSDIIRIEQQQGSISGSERLPNV